MTKEEADIRHDERERIKALIRFGMLDPSTPVFGGWTQELLDTVEAINPALAELIVQIDRGDEVRPDVLARMWETASGLPIQEWYDSLKSRLREVG